MPWSVNGDLRPQILSDSKSRKNYDYALAHPEETLYNEYQYYYSQYEKYWRTDARMVVAGFLAVVSLIQYASKQAAYQQARCHPRSGASFLSQCIALKEHRRQVQVWLCISLEGGRWGLYPVVWIAPASVVAMSLIWRTVLQRLGCRMDADHCMVLSGTAAATSVVSQTACPGGLQHTAMGPCMPMHTGNGSYQEVAEVHKQKSANGCGV